MTRFFAPAILFLIIALHCNGQWSWDHPLPQGNTLNDMFFHNSSGLGYAVGNRGVILKTENKGISWTLSDSVTTSELYCGSIIGNLGYIVGDNGLILKTSDNQTWSELNSGTHYRLNSVVFTDENSGYVAGYKGLIMKTNDAGQTWQVMNSETLYTLYSGYFFSDQEGFFVGDSGLILKTNDGGLSWTERNSGTHKALLDIDFPSPTTGYISGKNGLILKTTDAGETWTELVFTPVEENLLTLDFYNDTIGYAAGVSGAILKTINGGNTWSFIPTGTTLTVRSLTNLYHNDTLCDSLIFCGDYGIIQRTDSCGYWKNITGASTQTFSAVLFNSGLKGLAVGGDPYADLPALYTTPNPGSKWQKLEVDTIKHYLTDSFFLDDTTTYISGRKGSIYKTSDNGGNWVPLKSGTNEDLYSILFVEPEMGFACGTGGTFIKTTSGDTTWSEINTGINEILFSLFFFDAENGGYAVGDNGKILRIKNTGNQISTVPSGTNAPLYDIFFPTENLGFAVGYAGKILKIKRGATTDSIFTIPSGVLTPLNKVYFPGPDTGYIVGEGGVILKTIDGGESWYPQYTGTANSLRGIYFIDNDEGFSVGAGLTILQTENGGGGVILPGIFETITEDSPISIYPNPASTSITIEFNSEVNQISQVILFDLSGRLMKLYENLGSHPGIQPLQLDIADLETGIYLVVLQTKNRFYARKLIIL